MKCIVCGSAITKKQRESYKQYHSRKFCSMDCQLIKRKENKPSIADRFNKMVVKKEECWEWIGSRTRQNRPKMVNHLGKNEHASRVSYRIHKGDFDSQLFVLHKCDNPVCTNPDHLFLGTQKDNIDDMYMKGRNASFSGERNSQSKLETCNILNIRKRYKEGDSFKYLANWYGVTESTISDIVNRRTWKHVK